MQIARGGCQCGAVRYAVEEFGRAAVCHCRMCQKAFGNFFGPLVTAKRMNWTRGKPRYYRSSNRAQRGFCETCGTPLCYEPDGGEVEVAIGTLDDPNQVAPAIQVGLQHKLTYVDGLPTLPHRPSAELPQLQAFLDSVQSYQHPDRD